MGSRRPHRFELVDGRYPVRLTLHLDAQDPRDWRNDSVRRWLQAQVGEGGYAAVPAIARWSGERIIHLHLPDIHTAMGLMLRHPHLRLALDPYRGPPQ